MADALPGAPAPVPAAVRAALSTPHDPAAAAAVADAGAPAGAVVSLPPLQLLRQLDCWMQHNGLNDCHPWRLSILNTLAQYGNDQAAVPAAFAGHVFGAIAELIEGLEALLSTVLNDRADLWPAVFAVVGQIGWFADEGCNAHGALRSRDDAAAWLMSPRMQDALRAIGQVTGAKGGCSMSRAVRPVPKAAPQPAPAVGLHDRMVCELLPLLRAADLLANCLRVLGQFRNEAEIRPAFGDALRQACPTWCDPFSGGDDEVPAAVVSELLRVASEVGRQMAEQGAEGGAA